ncbi:hypothetical protein L3X38_026554 [Prunus dulcis]|uniref:Uncharacterized protein n=1 Tax=Prunus dulcis TaxID=3755 RepID=A0AAD4Z0B6_PRUDU|nr:hypothetical protein L3X38_026554 [Prunus dulcis]
MPRPGQGNACLEWLGLGNILGTSWAQQGNLGKARPYDANEAKASSFAAKASPTTRAFSGPRPLLRVGKQAVGVCVSSSPNSDLEAFSHNPAHGCFTRPKTL